MISIVIAVKDDQRIAHTLKYLEHVIKPENTEVLVIDASEGRLDTIKKQYPNVIWINYLNKTTKKRTFVEQINLGSRKAKGDIIVYLDADCIPTKNWLTNIIKPIRQENE